MSFTVENVAAPADLPHSETNNPFWDIVRTIPGDGIDWKYERRWVPTWIQAYRDTSISRDVLCERYAWAIADPMALRFVAEHLAPQAIEIGAGTGYWAWQLSQIGIDILAFDLYPPQLTGENHYHSPRTEDDRKLMHCTRDVFFEVQEGDEKVARHYPERTLFLCWPPYDTDMASNCLNYYAGNKLVYIGEGDGGCNADDAFFETLSTNWNEVATHPIVQWWGLHDHITVYERKRYGED